MNKNTIILEETAKIIINSNTKHMRFCENSKVTSQIELRFKIYITILNSFLNLKDSSQRNVLN